jgi:hypothetical protein
MTTPARAPSTRPNHSRIKRRQSIALVLWLTAPPLPRPAAPAVERDCLYGLMRQALPSGYRPSRSSRAASGRSGLLRLEPWQRDKGPSIDHNVPADGAPQNIEANAA